MSQVFPEQYTDWKAYYNQHHITKDRELLGTRPLTVRDEHEPYRFEWFNEGAKKEMDFLWGIFKQYVKMHGTPHRSFLKWAKRQTPGSLTGGVRYYSKEERQGRKAEFKDQKIKVPFILKETQNPFSRLPGFAIIFVIDKDDIVYVEQKVRGVIQHSTLRAGKPVKSAGTIYACPPQKDGWATILVIANHSGHYGPSGSHVQIAATVFQNQGLNIANINFYVSERIYKGNEILGDIS